VKAVDKFLALIEPEPMSGCWLWAGSFPACNRYGRFPRDGKWRAAHRVAWELLRGAIPDGLCVLHKCDVTACVNPDHLFLGTHTDNMRDMVSKRRHAFHRDPTRIKRGRQHGAAKLADDKILSIRNLSKRGETQAAIARQFGISQGHVWRIVHGTRWAHVGAER